jgi:chromate reductase
MPHVLAISGSSAAASINRLLLEHAVSLITGATTEVVSVLDFPAPIYSPEVENAGFPKTMTALHEKVIAADALILASPEHNGGSPAMLKNAIDWLSRAAPGQNFLPKPVLLLSTSPGGRGGSGNLDSLATRVPFWGAQVVGKVSVAKFYDVFDADRGLTDPLLAAELQAGVTAIVAAAESAASES